MKENLSDNIVDEKQKKFLFDEDNIKKLFDFSSDEVCDSFPEKENEKGDLENLVITFFLLLLILFCFKF